VYAGHAVLHAEKLQIFLLSFWNNRADNYNLWENSWMMETIKRDFSSGNNGLKCFLRSKTTIK
jgi:hypothetical protein